jgi:heme ABC exporter ATP-binding subunit CcmA
METDPVVQLVDVVAVLDRFPALAGATLTVHRGEIVLLRGPNGAGKSTLLRLCAGLVAPERGSATVLGLDLAVQRQAVRARVGLLGHANGLYIDLTVSENVDFWGATVSASHDEIAAALDRMGLSGRLSGVPVRKLSAGQRRRTALACLIARRAELWLLDEPHAGLDAAGRDELDTVLRAATAAGATMIVASHELERAGALATRVVDVAGGQIRESGAS